MVSYNPRSDKIEVLNGRIISSQKAEQIQHEINKTLKLRESYINSELSKKDITVTSRTIKILCSDYECNTDIFVTIGFSFDDVCSKIPEEYIIAWVNKWDSHGEILTRESDVKSIFEETNAEFEAFNVRFADAHTRKKFRDELKKL